MYFRLLRLLYFLAAWIDHQFLELELTVDLPKHLESLGLSHPMLESIQARRNR
jgi:hypothetical protein